MKKVLKAIGSVVIIAFACILGAVGGFILSTMLFSGDFTIPEIAVVILGIALAFYVAIIIHEGGHLLFGLLSGYGFSSFRIGNFIWIKQDEGIKLRRLSIAGTGGQCLMTPPENKEGKIPVVLYNLGGVFANLILAAILLLAYFLFAKKLALLNLILLFGGVISLVVALTNGLPLNVGGIANDGMNALHLSRNQTAAKAFVAQLRMNAAQARGMRVSKMPDEWFSLPEGADMQNVHCASIAVFSAGRTLDRLDTEGCEMEVNALLHSDYNIIGLHKNLLKCDLVFARLINHGRGAEISSLLTMEQLKFMKMMDNYPSVIRTEYAIALLRDGDEKRGEKIRADFEKMAKKYPYPADIEAERQLLDLALQKFKNEQ